MFLQVYVATNNGLVKNDKPPVAMFSGQIHVVNVNPFPRTHAASKVNLGTELGHAATYASLGSKE
jgi:hypothetical protein